MSAGGLDVLRDIVAAIPSDFPAAIAVVMHTSAESPGVLRHILAKVTRLPCVSPTRLEWLRPGTIYVAPPDHHMLVIPGHICVSKGPKENRFRPAIDPLFRSAAQVYGPNAVGVIMSGSLDDGVAGLWAIKRRGGVAIVQDPDEALFPALPRNALAYVTDVDHVVPSMQIPELLVQLTGQPERDVPSEIPEDIKIELSIAKQEDPIQAGVGRLGKPSVLSCPECHGVLLQLKEAGHIRFRCHTGHAYSMGSLLTEVRCGIETQLWNAIRAMQEGDMLMRAMAEHIQDMHMSIDCVTLMERAAELQGQIATLRQMVTSGAEPVEVD